MKLYLFLKNSKQISLKLIKSRTNKFILPFLTLVTCQDNYIIETRWREFIKNKFELSTLKIYDKNKNLTCSPIVTNTDCGPMIP